MSKNKDEDFRLFRVSWWIGSGSAHTVSLQVFVGLFAASKFKTEKEDAGYNAEILPIGGIV